MAIDTTAAVTKATRINVRFSPSGNHAVSLVGLGPAGWRIERWRLTADGDERSMVSLPTGEFAPIDEFAQLRIDDDGTVTVLARIGTGGYAVFRIAPTDDGPVDWPWALLDARQCELASTAPVVISRSGGTSTLWAANAPSNGLCRIAAVDGVVKNGFALTPSARHVAFNVLGATRPPTTIVVDCDSGVTNELFPDLEGYQLLRVGQASGRLVCAVNLPAEPRFATATLDPLTLTGTPPVESRQLSGLAGSVRTVALDDAGEALFLAVQRGVRSVLIRHNIRADTYLELDTPLGVVVGDGAYRGGSLRVPFTTPHEPLGIATVSADRFELSTPRPLSSTVRVPRGTAYRPESMRPAVRPVVFYTPDGEIEGLVYGERWETAQRVLMAIHGGPAAQWQADHEPTLLDLADAGMSVVAINQRGSTGYGRRHQDAINNAWGGPDLDDINRIADEMAETRSRSSLSDILMIYGGSYGAFLALLAASVHPTRWSHCVAVSPFLSGERLYTQAPDSVRRTLDRLGGRRRIDDHIGPRDVLRLSPNMTARTLLVHGALDGLIPVSHSRELHAHLEAVGACADLTYIEVNVAGHSVYSDNDGRPIATRIVDHLTKPSMISVNG